MTENDMWCLCIPISVALWGLGFLFGMRRESVYWEVLLIKKHLAEYYLDKLNKRQWRFKNRTKKEMNPLSWLPKPGEFKKIPGGVLWCEMWEYEVKKRGLAEGKIVFRFECDEAEYVKTMATTQELPSNHPTPLRLPAKE